MSEVSTLALSLLPNKPTVVAFCTGDTLPLTEWKHVSNQNGDELVVWLWETLSTAQHTEDFVLGRAETSTKFTAFEVGGRVSLKEMVQCQDLFWKLFGMSGLATDFEIYSYDYWKKNNCIWNMVTVNRAAIGLHFS